MSNWQLAIDKGSPHFEGRFVYCLLSIAYFINGNWVLSNEFVLMCD